MRGRCSGPCTVPLLVVASSAKVCMAWSEMSLGCTVVFYFDACWDRMHTAVVP